MAWEKILKSSYTILDLTRPRRPLQSKRGAAMSDQSNKTKNPLDIETFTIKPTVLKTVRLGKFRVGDPEPKFRVVYHTHDLENPNVISHHDVSVYHKDGTYELFRHFQSYSQQVHTLTVRFASAQAKSLEREQES
ncbi:hypothetical protein G3I59_02945 [Amycolatopsis rubida]|uniref:Uncharacterized protein n=1 Tax=Amycolatopsis rubida TaxID=112413 RepID=A0ABX0BJF5_9PSEU|nr:hypothetical protein [Amycolatopsis sp. M39]MYW89607.1 hypothetical protein [Amycolatopsis rubida]NEC54584.1 hypothetical protein [Amycolatopsis rubida]